MKKFLERVLLHGYPLPFESIEPVTELEDTRAEAPASA